MHRIREIQIVRYATRLGLYSPNGGNLLKLEPTNLRLVYVYNGFYNITLLSLTASIRYGRVRFYRKTRGSFFFITIIFETFKMFRLIFGKKKKNDILSKNSKTRTKVTKHYAVEVRTDD